MNLARTLLIFLLLLPPLLQAEPLKTKNVFLITLDGYRWQELFSGADENLIEDKTVTRNPKEAKKRFWRSSPEKRREVLMPFIWKTVAKKGRLYGNRRHGNKVNVTNPFWFSYPGYSEILVGFADKRIDSNDKKNNPNQSVLEFLNGEPEFKGKVAVFASWDTFPYILNRERSGLYINSGFEGVNHQPLSPREGLLNEMLPEIQTPWETVRFDAFTYHYTMEYLKKNDPRLLYVAFAETDDFAHQGRYDAYLRAANQIDRFVERLWDWIQSKPEYKDKTTLILTTDHGRGYLTAEDWKGHNRKIPGSDEIWFAVMGPDTPPLGEIKKEGELFQNQIAGTLASFLGQDYKNHRPVGEAIAGAMR